MDTYQKFVNSIALADHNVLIIFLLACGAVAAWYCIALFPQRTQRLIEIIGWLYALLALTLTVIYSIGG